MNYIGLDGRVHNDELKHFNPYHDRLGRFAKAGSGGVLTARQYTKTLNKLEREYVLNKGESLRTDRKRAKLLSKKPRSQRALNRYNKKLDKYNKRVTQSNKNVHRSVDLGRKYMSEAMKSGKYDIYAKPTYQSSQRGRDFANAYASMFVLGGVAGSGLIMAKNKRQYSYYGQKYGGDTPSRIATNKYKVVNRKKKR